MKRMNETAAVLALMAILSGWLPAQDQTTAPQAEQVQELEREIQALETKLAQLRREAASDLTTEQSVKPGINDSWKSDEIEPLVARLESESREIYTERQKIAALVGPVEGSVVADVGSGSGFMAMLLAERVGPGGKVYAVDINPAMLEAVSKEAGKRGLENLDTVVCTEKSVELEPASVDLIFICDTYHHFEYPRNTMTSIHQALKPGGQVVVVDFHRIPGVSRDWVLDHVRAGQEVFAQEIVEAGFELVNDHSGPLLDENYVLRFRKR